MDPNEILHAAPALAKGAGALAAALPFTSVVKRMLGPAADEVAEMWRDQVRLYRYERQLKCVEKAERMAKEAGFTPQAVPLKILFPLLEGASMEEDENLHDMWAALLANASLEHTAEKIKPGFIAVLKQMSPDEALLLRFVADRKPSFGEDGFYPRMYSENNPAFISFDDLLVCLEGLVAARLLHNAVSVPPNFEPHYTRILDDDGPYYVTVRGQAFLEAVRPPKPKE